MARADQSGVTVLLDAIRAGDANASERLFPLVYEELRRIARARMAGLGPGQTLQATALVHEAYLKLLGPAKRIDGWDDRAHFFGAAARAMRNILVDQARRRACAKRGGGAAAVPLEGSDGDAAIEMPSFDLLALDEALHQLEAGDPSAYRVVMLRYFAGLNDEEAADVLGISVGTLRREWAYARAWLHRAMNGPK
jgi:RNA polymerase sigma factor (TIGR02999 family)